MSPRLSTMLLLMGKLSSIDIPSLSILTPVTEPYEPVIWEEKVLLTNSPELC